MTVNGPSALFIGRDLKMNRSIWVSRFICISRDEKQATLLFEILDHFEIKTFNIYLIKI